LVIQELLEAANYLVLNDVIKLCCNHMVDNLDQENALDVLLLADNLCLTELKYKAIDFVGSKFQVRNLYRM
jgi:hypothetical protein